jgi:hypothetical protein
MGTVPSRLIKILRFGIKGAPWKIEIIHFDLRPIFPSPLMGGCGWPPAQRASGSERGEPFLFPPPLHPVR